jgi:hypothetical protein
MSLLACCTRVSIRALGALRVAHTVCGETEAAAGPSPPSHRCGCDRTVCQCRCLLVSVRRSVSVCRVVAE